MVILNVVGEHEEEKEKEKEKSSALKSNNPTCRVGKQKTRVGQPHRSRPAPDRGSARAPVLIRILQNGIFYKILFEHNLPMAFPASGT